MWKLLETLIFRGVIIYPSQRTVDSKYCMSLPGALLGLKKDMRWQI